MTYSVKPRRLTNSPVWILLGVLRGVLNSVSMLTLEGHAHEMWSLLSCGQIWTAMSRVCTTQDLEERQVTLDYQHNEALWFGYC